MKPLASWPTQARRQLLGVFTDIDDTLTTEGVATPDALAALQELRAAGLHVVAVTGRPVGWSEPFAREWPIDAIVAENGAVALVRDSDTGELRKLYQQPEAVRQANVVRIQEVASRIVQTIPGANLSRDSGGRETDIAIDHSEFTTLDAGRIAQVVRLMQDQGLHATVSSIHINGWLGDHDKLTGARWITQHLFRRPLDAEVDRWAFVGDSTNDVLMFGHFRHSIAVANVRRFEAQLTCLPRYITPSERGAGFREVADAILDCRPS